MGRNDYIPQPFRLLLSKPLLLRPCQWTASHPAQGLPGKACSRLSLPLIRSNTGTLTCFSHRGVCEKWTHPYTAPEGGASETVTIQGVSMRAGRKEALQTLLLIVGTHDQGLVIMIQILRIMKLMQVSRIFSPMVALPELLACSKAAAVLWYF